MNITRIIDKVKNFSRMVIAIALLILSYCIPRDEKLWIFIAGNGERFAENSKYLYLHCENKQEVRNIWISTNDKVIKDLQESGHEAYQKDSVLGKIFLLRAGVICETHGPQFWPYLGGATVIDLHHGNALKHMGNDKQMSKNITSKLINLVWEHVVKTPYFLVTNSGEPLKIFKNAKNIDSSKLIVGPYPRLDALLRDIPDSELGTNQEELFKIASLSEDNNIIFYTPTWRRAFNEENGIPLLKLKPDFDEIDDFLASNQSKMFISSHPREEMKIEYENYEHIFPLRNGDDIYPYLKYCDILITDYSSIFYDFTVLNNPMIFYAPDLEEYKSSRGLYYDYHKHVPGCVANSTTELITQLEDTLSGIGKFETDREKIRKEFYMETKIPASEYIYKKIQNLTH